MKIFISTFSADDAEAEGDDDVGADCVDAAAAVGAADLGRLRHGGA